MKIAIIGGGLTGLVLGYKLSRHHQVTIYESSKSLGGLTSTFKIGDSQIEKYYHHIFTGDKDLQDLLKELKLINKLKWYETNNALHLDSFKPFATVWDLLNLSDLNLIDKIKLGLLTLNANKDSNDKLLDKITAKNWVLKKAGSKIYKYLWEPLLKSKFDSEAKNISALWLKNKIKLRSKSRRHFFSKETFGYLDGSFSVLIDTLVKKIKKNQGKIILNYEVNQIVKKDDKVIIKKQSFDKLIYTGPDEKLYQMLQLAKTIKSIPYMANICALFILKKSFTKYYWTTVLDSDYPFIALIEQTNMIKNRYNHKKLLYVSRYLKADNPLFKMTNTDIKKLFIKFLLKINPEFNKKDILECKISKAEYAQPIIKKNYFKNIKPFKTQFENIYLVNMTQIYPEDRGINHAVRLANIAIKEIFDE